MLKAAGAIEARALNNCNNSIWEKAAPGNPEIGVSVKAPAYQSEINEAAL